RLRARRAHLRGAAVRWTISSMTGPSGTEEEYLDDRVLAPRLPGFLLVHTDAGPTFQPWPLFSEEIVVGRSPFARISFPQDARLSSEHFAIRYDERAGVHVVRHLSPTNKTFVDGVAIEGELAARSDGAVIRGGNVILMTRSAIPERVDGDTLLTKQGYAWCPEMRRVVE